MKRNLFFPILLLLHLCSFVLTAKERKLRVISMDDDDVILSPGISCIQIESTFTCYGVNANRSVIHFLNKTIDNWSSWNAIILEDPTYDVKLDGISCVLRKTLPKCYLRMTNVGIEHLIEINPSKETWYQLCDHLATKPITILTEEMNINILSRTIKNEFYYKYVKNSQWNLKKILSKNKEFMLIGESSCVSIDDNQQIICFSRTDNPTRLAIWSRREDSFQWIDDQQENQMKFSSDLSCLAIVDEEQTKIICFVVNQDENIYGMLCQMNFICSKWFLINSKINSFQKSKPISFIYNSLNTKNENLAIYALANNKLPYITTCQQCIHSIENWSQWMELTSKPLSSIQSIFRDFQQEKVYIIALTDDFQFTYSIFNYQNHIPSPFYKLNNTFII